MEQENTVLRCNSCGAKLIANSLLNARCAYCGSVHFIKEAFKTDFIPDAIVRFQNTNDKAKKMLKDFIETSSAVNQKLSNEYEIVSITPMYVPCTIFNYGVSLYKKYHYETSGESQHVYNVESKTNQLYTIVQDGSVNVDDSFIYSIEPFDFSKLQKFNPIYLSGTYTELNQDKYVLNKAIKAIEKTILNNTRMDNGVLDCNIYTIDNIKAYLPVWFANVKRKEKVYTFVMNDTTNKWVTNAERKESINKEFFSFLFSLFILPLVGLFGSFLYSILPSKSMMLTLILAATFCGILLSVFPTISRNKRKQSYIKSVDDVDIKPIQTKEIFNKNISSSDIIKEKMIRFYMDGKQI